MCPSHLRWQGERDGLLNMMNVLLELWLKQITCSNWIDGNRFHVEYEMCVYESIFALLDVKAMGLIAHWIWLCFGNPDGFSFCWHAFPAELRTDYCIKHSEGNTQILPLLGFLEKWKAWRRWWELAWLLRNIEV